MVDIRCKTCAIYDRMGRCYLKFESKQSYGYLYEKRKTADDGITDWCVGMRVKPVHHHEDFCCPNWRDAVGRNKEQAIAAEAAGRR